MCWVPSRRQHIDTRELTDILLNWWYRHRSENLSKDDIDFDLAGSLLLLQFASQVNDLAFSPALVVGRSRTAIFSAESFLAEELSTETLQSLLSFMKAFQKRNMVHLIDVSIMDILDDMISVNCMDVNSKWTSLRSRSVWNVMSNHFDVLVFLLKYKRDTASSKGF